MNDGESATEREALTSASRSFLPREKNAAIARPDYPAPRAFRAPPRPASPDALARPPLRDWATEDWLSSAAWPSIDALDRRRAEVESEDGRERPAFRAQTPDLLRDRMHYEQRIAERAIVATREENWHDLFNALVWLRYPSLKRALNGRQVAEIARNGPKQRSRAQCALTHFDEGGAIVLVADPQLLAYWDAHDWDALFWRERGAWQTRIAVLVFGHALLEHALAPGQLIVAKSLVFATDAATVAACAAEPSGGAATRAIETAAANAVAAGDWLADPQELRPLPLSGIPGWHGGNVEPSFYAHAPCFRPLRAGRRYPAPRIFPPTA